MSEEQPVQQPEVSALEKEMEALLKTTQGVPSPGTRSHARLTPTEQLQSSPCSGVSLPCRGTVLTAHRRRDEPRQA